MHSPRAFTLIELLVVITVIVVLISLLAPAMDRALYQAELAVCAGNLRAGTTGVIGYAMNFRRAFPDRPGTDFGVLAPENIKLGRTHLNTAQAQGQTFDDRPKLAPYMSINGVFRDPLVEAVDYEVDDPDTTIWTAYWLWFGWDYLEQNGYSGSGPSRLGQQLTFENESRFGVYPQGFSFKSNLLMNDRDTYAFGTATLAGHPDSEGRLHQNVMDNEMVDRGTQDAFVRSLEMLNGKTTLVEWAGDSGRGTLDTNHGYQDASVQRLDNVDAFAGVSDDPRTTFIPLESGPFLFPWLKGQVPAR